MIDIVEIKEDRCESQKFYFFFFLNFLRLRFIYLYFEDLYIGIKVEVFNVKLCEEWRVDVNEGVKDNV